MRRFLHCAVGISALSLAVIAPAIARASIQTFAVLRDNRQIGTNTIDIERDGLQTVVRSVTHVEVKLLFVTVYRFDETEVERWANGELLALDASTDNNGTLHKTTASRSGGAMTVQEDGRAKQVASNTVPISLWNEVVPAQRPMLNPQDGSIVPVSVADRGEETLVIRGRPYRARHYVITSTYSQDAWYDQDHHLVQVELKGSDGSTIQYRIV